MLIYEKGNLLSGKYNVICHQVNCKGVMGAGLAKQIRNKYPFVYFDYTRALQYENAGLGHIVVSHVDDGNCKIIISMFGQDGYGRDKKYTDYNAFKECLKTLKKTLDAYSTSFISSVAFPENIGCGLAGGNWNIILPMIQEFADNIKQDVYIVRFA